MPGYCQRVVSGMLQVSTSAPTLICQFTLVVGWRMNAGIYAC